VKASVENKTKSPRRHSTMPESFSINNMSCKRRTNLLRRTGPLRSNAMAAASTGQLGILGSMIVPVVEKWKDKPEIEFVRGDNKSVRLQLLPVAKTYQVYVE
jgi:hypothetical protein